MSPLHADESLAKLKPFLETYCYECHGAKKQKNDLRFDTLPFDLADGQVLGIWQDILDQLNRGEMPPKKAATHPSLAEAAIAVEKLTPILRSAYAQQRSTNRETVVRRLNRFELRNTIRDLLYLDEPEFRVDNVSRLVDNNGNGSVANTSKNPFRHFPADEVEEGFDNIGDRLVMSDFFLKLMVAAAEESIGMATRLEERPQVETRRLEKHIAAKGNYSQSAPGALELFQRQLGHDYDAIYRRYWRFGRLRPEALRKGVGVSARYRITIEASAHNQSHPWGEVVRTNQDESLQMGLHLVNHRNERSSRPMKRWEIPGDGVKRSYTFETHIDQEWLPWIGWENGPDPKTVWADPILRKYRPEAHREAPDRKNKEAHAAWLREQAMEVLEDGYAGPHLRIYSLTLEPLIEQWPPKSHTALYGTGPIEEADLEEFMLTFAKRAFRGPVGAKDIAPYVALVRGQLVDAEAPAGAIKALQAGYAAMLCSPRFLYLREEAGALDHYQVASRLSYFLWSSMPDERLMGLAAEGQLRDPAVLSREVDRMLDDPRAAAFTRHFTERWLRLDKLADNPPERGGPFRVYHDRQLEMQIVAQTDAYFADLLQRNGELRQLIDSDYTFLNEPVASIFYKRDDVKGEFFRRVPTNDPRRGGILTHPSVMTATANGVDTSPVVRGVFILENILGTPPSPPPPDVEPLSPDLRGAATIRERLERHREVASCNNCHRKIDPMGFAFENFNPVGWWRDVYRDTRKKIDPAATLTNGDEVPDIIALKKFLLTREDDVARCLTRKLLVYASGRTLEPADRGEIDRIVLDLKARGNGLRDLVMLVAQSELVLTK